MKAPPLLDPMKATLPGVDPVIDRLFDTLSMVEQEQMHSIEHGQLKGLPLIRAEINAIKTRINARLVEQNSATRWMPRLFLDVGCGKHTHVEGTNGGMMRCGNMLKQLDGTVAPYFCAKCEPSWTQ